MNKIKIIVLIFIIIVLLGGFTAYNFISNSVKENPAGTVGNHAGNLYNKGLFCEHQGKVYFSNPYDDNTLYTMNPDESDIKKIGTVGINYLNAGGDYIYYYQHGTGAGAGLGYAVKTTGLYRTSLNGKDLLCLKRDLIGTVILVDNNIYYQRFDNSNGVLLDQISIDKENEANVMPGVIAPVSAKDSVLYFANPEDNFYLYSYDTRYGTKSLFWQHRVYNPIYHTDGYIYFMDIDTTYQLHRYHPMTGEHQVLTTDRVECFNVYDNMIYYQKYSSSQPALMRMQTDGYGLELVYNGSFTNINITSNYVYFTEYGSATPVYKQSLYGSVNPTVFNP